MDTSLWTDWRHRRSPLRGSVLVALSLIASFPLAHFPTLQPNLWVALPILVACVGTADTLRCMRTRWSWYHGGVVLCIYMDLMAVVLMLFFLIYPFWIA